MASETMKCLCSSFGALRSLATLTAIVTPTVAFSGGMLRWDSHGVGRRDGRPLRSLAFNSNSNVRMMSAGPKVPIQITGNNIEVNRMMLGPFNFLRTIFGAGYSSNQRVRKREDRRSFV